IVDYQTAPIGPAGSYQHAIYFIDPSGVMSRHIIPSTVISAAGIICPVAPSEGANSPQVGYAADHMWLVSLGVSTGPLQLNALRYRASRPGYGSDVDQT